MALAQAALESPDQIIVAKMQLYAHAVHKMKTSDQDEIPTSAELEEEEEEEGEDSPAAAAKGRKEERGMKEEGEALKKEERKNKVKCGREGVKGEEVKGKGEKEEEKAEIRTVVDGKVDKKEEEKAEEGKGEEGKKEEEVVKKKDLSARSSINRQKRLREALKSKLYDSTDKDGSYFSYEFLEKIFDDNRECQSCGATGSGRIPVNDDSLELFVNDLGVVGRQNIECMECGELDTVVSSKHLDDVPSDPRLRIRGLEVRYFCQKVTHYEILHDLMELLHIAAMDDEKARQEKHAEVAEFMLRNARKVCEEWCKPEYAELRMKKYLQLREETLLFRYKPKFMPNSTQDYREMYGMMADSFRENRGKILLLLSLLKDSLIDNPTRPTFMMWVSIAMMHSENYADFKALYDPQSYMRVDETEYNALKDRYLALDVPLGIKKIPVVFILFEVPRFYHYVDFLMRRLGNQKPTTFLSDVERAVVEGLSEEAKRLGIKKEPKSGQIISPEAHLNFLTKKEEIERKMIYHSCRERDLMRMNAEFAMGKRDLIPQPESRDSGKPVIMTTDEFRSVLYDHLKANEASPVNKIAPISPTPTPTINPHSRRAKKEAKRAKKWSGGDDADKKTVLVAQVDTDLLKRQGFRVSANSKTTTVVYSKEGKLEHVLEGIDTPEQVKAFLSHKYSIRSQTQGTGYISMPTHRDPEGFIPDTTSAMSQLKAKEREKATEASSRKRKEGSRKKKRAAEKAKEASFKEPDDTLKGFPFTADWSEKNRDRFKEFLIKGIEDATNPGLEKPIHHMTLNGISALDDVTPLGSKGEREGEGEGEGRSKVRKRKKKQRSRGKVTADSPVVPKKGEEAKETESPATTDHPVISSKATASDKISPPPSPSTSSKPSLSTSSKPSDSINDLDDVTETVSSKCEKEKLTPATETAIESVSPSEEGQDQKQAEGKSRKTARDKFRSCEGCGEEIKDRIQVCSGCKKVAYCDGQCQRSHWKMHKKTCTYALKKDSK